MEAKTQYWLRKVLAIFSGAVGLCLLFAITVGEYRIFSETNSVSDLLSHLLFFLYPGIIFYLATGFFILTAARLWKCISSQNLRSLSIVLATIAFMLLLSILSPLERKYFPNPGREFVPYSTPLIWILVGLFHLACNRSLHSWFHVGVETDYRKHERAVKWYFCFLALFFIMPLFDIIEPIAMQSDRELNPWLVLLDLALAVGVISIGWGIYRLGSRFYIGRTL
jgi:hypothetical protein